MKILLLELNLCTLRFSNHMELYVRFRSIITFQIHLHCRDNFISGVNEASNRHITGNFYELKLTSQVSEKLFVDNLLLIKNSP